jgi:hypothetical protein
MHTSRPVIPDDAQLEWLIEGNPKLIGSPTRKRFEKSFGAPTVAEHKTRGGKPWTYVQISIAGSSELDSAVAVGLMAPGDPARDSAAVAWDSRSTIARSVLHLAIS